MVDSTATVNRLGEESIVESDNRHTLNIWEKENDSHSPHAVSISQPCSNHKVDSIKHVELDTNKNKRREWPKSNFRLTSSRRFPLRSSPFLRVSFPISPFLVVHCSIFCLFRQCLCSVCRRPLCGPCPYRQCSASPSTSRGRRLRCLATMATDVPAP